MQTDESSPANGANVETSTEVRLEQIAKIAQNARASWFGLLALLVFVGVTLMGHEDTDFFAFGAETELPLVSISVPTVSFFIAAPTLTAALYVYLHIYLRGLWVALAKCPARLARGPLEERVYPTMLCTSALVVRRWMRHESGKPVEGPRTAAVTISFLMVWLLGPVVLGILWWSSTPYHHEWLTLWAAFCFWLALIVGTDGLYRLFCLMHSEKSSTYSIFPRPFASPRPIIAADLLVVLAIVSWDATEGGRFVPLATANLARAELTHKPAHWMHYDIWLKDQKYQFRDQENLGPAASDEAWSRDEFARFQSEAAARWAALTQSLDSPDLRGADLRSANLTKAFVSGADLRGARFDGADLRETRFDGADLDGARFDGADLREAWFGGANLSGARFEDADLRGARFDAASLIQTRFLRVNLTSTRFDGADLRGVQFEDADLRAARFDGADVTMARFTRSFMSKTGFRNANLGLAQFDFVDLSSARFEGANLHNTWFQTEVYLTSARFDGATVLGARFERADLRWTRFQDADLTGSRFNGANLTGARFDRAHLDETRLDGADLTGVRFDGAHLRETRLSGADLTGVRFDGADLREVRAMTQLQLDSACGDQHTRVHEKFGLALPACPDVLVPPICADGITLPTCFNGLIVPSCTGELFPPRCPDGLNIPSCGKDYLPALCSD